MDAINLTGPLSFAIAFSNKQFRLLVSDGNKELVCHKVTDKELSAFMSTDNAHLFKGRLQLNKSGDDISIIVKGSIVSVLRLAHFAQLSAAAKMTTDDFSLIPL